MVRPGGSRQPSADRPKRPGSVMVPGFTAGGCLMAGAWIGKRFVLRLHPDRFRLLMDGLMLLSGLTMLYTALR